MKKKAKLQIYTASNDYFVATITIGDKGYYICCDRREDMTGRIPQLTQWTSTSRTLHEAIVRSTENGEYYTKVVSVHITIDNYDIIRGAIGGKSSETIINKTIEYLSSRLGWHFPTTPPL